MGIWRLFARRIPAASRRPVRRRLRCEPLESRLVPAATAIDLVAASDTGAFNDDNYTADNTPTLAVTADPGQTVEVLVNGTVAATATEGSTPGSYTATLAANLLRVGENTLAAREQGDAAQVSLTVTYAPDYQNVFTVPGAPGTPQQLTFTFGSRESVFRSEVGVYVVDDFAGRVGSAEPGDAGYAQAALNSASRQVLFSPTQAPGAATTLTFNGGALLAFYLIPNNTSATFLSTNPTNSPTGSPLAFFSLPTANPDNQDHVQAAADALLGSAQYAWEDFAVLGDSDFNDVVFSVEAAGAAGTPGEAVRVPVGAGRTLTTVFTLQTATKARPGLSPVTTTTSPGEVGLFQVDAPDGRIGTVMPGDPGYAQAALNSSTRQVLFQNGAPANSTQNVSLPGGALVGFYLIPGSTANDFLANNPNNSAGGSPVALFSFDAATPDGGAEHFRLSSPELVAQAEPIAGRPLFWHARTGLNGTADAFDDLRFSMSSESGAYTSGGFTNPHLLGTRTDLLPGAPDINNRQHLTTPIDYSAFSNPPAYGPHDPSPLATGVYTTPQTDADLVHNLEHGHVWISYDPSLISSADLAALESLVRSFGPQEGIVLTPRPANDTAIALTSWAHLLTLSSFDAKQVRNFILTNRGHAPEGYITP